MHNLLVQNKKVVFTALLIATISSYEQKGMILQSAEAGLLGLLFEELISPSRIDHLVCRVR